MGSTARSSPEPAVAAPDGAEPRCWEFLGCDRDGCPARARAEAACWRTKGTLCREHRGNEWALKFEQCLLCPVFVSRAAADPRGWNRFVAEELKHVIRDALGQTLENMESFFQILTSLPDGLLTVDQVGRVNYFNPAAEQITGLAAGQVLGRRCREALEEVGSGFELARERAFQVRDRVDNFEFEIRRRDGTSVPVISSASAIEDADGRVIGAVEVFKDITVRKRLEDELKLSDTKYRRIFEGSKDMIFVISQQGKIRVVNPAAVELLGYGSKEELLALRSVEDLYVNPLHAKVFQKQIDRWGFIKDFETFFKTRDGTRVHCLLSGNAVRQADGTIVGYEGIAKDISARMDAVQSLQQRHRELSLLNTVALTMNATQELDGILETALVKVLEVLNLKAGGVFLIDHSRSDLTLRGWHGPPAWAGTGDSRVTLRDTALMRSLVEESLCLAPERAFPPFKADLSAREVDEDSLELTCLLINGTEQARGFLALVLPPNRTLTDSDLGLLGSLGNFLGGAVENARLHETVRQHREELRDLTARLFQSQEFERRRLARELHDEAGQALTGIHLTLEAIDQSLATGPASVRELVADVRRQVNRTYQEMRRISHRLHPALLSDLGLEPALEAYMTRIAGHSGVEVEFRVVGFDGRVDPEVETTLYRLAQEAFNNTLKHSGASRFRLSIVKSYPRIIFLAEDDGRGFDVAELEPGRPSLGLVSMRERAAMLGGTFSLRSEKGAGTKIRIEIPVKEPAGD